MKNLREGNLILMDYDNRNVIAKPFMRQIVKRVIGDNVEFENESIYNFNRCTPIDLSEYWFLGYKFERVCNTWIKDNFIVIETPTGYLANDKPLLFLHDLQNAFADFTGKPLRFPLYEKSLITVN